MSKVLSLVAILVFAAQAATAQQPLVPAAARAPLEKASLTLARTGRSAEWRELVTALSNLGLSGKALDKHRATGERYIKRARKNAPTRSAATKLRKALTTLDARIPEMTGEPQRRCAQLLLALDGSLAHSHTALGHVQSQGTWTMPGADKRRARRRAMAIAMAEAQKLDLAIVEGPSSNQLLQEALKRPGASAKFGKLELHTHFSQTKTTRILKQTLRTAAFINYLRKGKVAVPDYGRQTSVVLPNPTIYRETVRSLRSSGKVEADSAEAALRPGMFSWRFTNLSPQLQVSAVPMEVDQVVIWLTTLEYWHGQFPCLTAGRVDLACRMMVGQPIARMAELVAKDEALVGTLASDAAALAERKRFLMLAPAGMHGGLQWMRYLAKRGEAPLWKTTMREQVAGIQGDELLKASLMVQFLTEEGQFEGLDKRASEANSKVQSEALSKALGCDLQTIETRWNAWLLGLETGLVQRLGATAPQPSKSAAASLAMVRQIRQQANLTVPVDFDHELTIGCDKHADYLRIHRDQAERWPDCHEQYPDREGWSVDGVRAGHNAVVVSGIKSDKQAIDGWMATFYHRLPLLAPGLRRIGYARNRDVAVLDCGSMVDPMLETFDTVVLWPPHGMTNVPTRFTPEMPNPVPGEDQRRFGYPITLQHTARSSKLPVNMSMELRLGSEHGELVPCYFSSPGAPSNPVLAPANSFCLIPKAALKSGAAYWVRAEILAEKKVITWTFRT